MIDTGIIFLTKLVQTNGLPIALVIFATFKLDKFLCSLSANLHIYNKQLASLEMTIVKLTGSIDNLKDKIE